MRLNLGVVAVDIVADQSHIEAHIKSYFCYTSSFEDYIHYYRLEIKNIKEINIDTLVKKYTKVGIVTQKDNYPYLLYICHRKRLLIPSYTCEQHIIIKNQQTVTCYINEGDNESLMVLIRIIREIMLQEYENHGAVLVHSSVVDVGGEAALFVGDSGAGKSTIAFYLCKQGANYLANDKCILDQNLNVYSFPMAIRLSIPTVERVMGTLNGIVPRFDSPNDIFLNQQYRKWGSKHKVVLTVREYCRLARANQVFRSKLKTLVFPEITPGNHVFESSEPDDKIKSILLRNITISHERSKEDDWLDLARVSEQEKLRNKISIIDKLLFAKVVAIKFSTDQLEKVYGTIK